MGETRTTLGRVLLLYTRNGKPKHIYRRKSPSPHDLYSPPLDTAFKQQRLPAWQPILTPKWVIITFTLVGTLLEDLLSNFPILNGISSISKPFHTMASG